MIAKLDGFRGAHKVEGQRSGVEGGGGGGGDGRCYVERFDCAAP